eukprot:3283081-Pyramimonas_sp.AAC.1
MMFCPGRMLRILPGEGTSDRTFKISSSSDFDRRPARTGQQRVRGFQTAAIDEDLGGAREIEL